MVVGDLERRVAKYRIGLHRSEDLRGSGVRQLRGVSLEDLFGLSTQTFGEQVQSARGREVLDAWVEAEERRRFVPGGSDQ
jgi:hypothetical protein